MRKGLLVSRILFIVIFLLGNITAFAQGRVTGKVIDPLGAAIQGATVAVKGSANATQTAPNGTFSINAPNNATLVISYVGFATQEIPVSGRSSIDVTMSTTNAQMNEVVLIGYGTRQKKDLTGAVTQISTKDFQKGVITTPEQLIVGKVAGVNIISNNGQPGSGSTIRIRGGTSLNASNDPLFVIDGVPLDNGGIAGGNNPLSFINANDIESFTVLKDASAAAIYGTRAANGVIIITTKKGKSGKLRINFTSLNSVSELRDEVEVLSGDQIRTIVKANGTAAQIARLGTANTDWQKEIYQKAFASNNNLSFTGGIQKIPYRVSLGYLNQDGILKTDHLEKYSGALVLNPIFLDNHLKVDLNLKGSIQKYRFANQGAIGSAIFMDPTQPVYSNSKRFGGLFEFIDASGKLFGTRNPVGMLNDRHDNSNSRRSIGNIQFDYKFHFLPDLHANVNLGYDVSKGTGSIFVSDSSAIGYGDPTLATYIGGGENNTYKQTKTNQVFDFYLNYIKDISFIKTKVDATAGYSYLNNQTKNFNVASYYANGKKVINSDPLYPFDLPENTLISYFGRINFTILDRFLLTGTFRRDGSSRFSPLNRWANFPSVAFAWKLKDESFLQNSPAVSELKLRIGYGITGQQEIGNYNYLPRYTLSNQGAQYFFLKYFLPDGKAFRL